MLTKDSKNEYDLDGLMHQMMLMRAINRPCLTDVMVAPVGTAWEGTKPNGSKWQITKMGQNCCELEIN
jgi:hypothetical protein